MPAQPIAGCGCQCGSLRFPVTRRRAGTTAEVTTRTSLHCAAATAVAKLGTVPSLVTSAAVSSPVVPPPTSVVPPGESRWTPPSLPQAMFPLRLGVPRRLLAQPSPRPRAVSARTNSSCTSPLRSLLTPFVSCIARASPQRRWLMPGVVFASSSATPPVWSATAVLSAAAAPPSSFPCDTTRLQAFPISVAARLCWARSLAISSARVDGGVQLRMWATS